MIDEIATLTEDQFLELATIIYAKGFVDALTGVNYETCDERRKVLKVRIEEWLEI